MTYISAKFRLQQRFFKVKPPDQIEEEQQLERYRKWKEARRKMREKARRKREGKDSSSSSKIAASEILHNSHA